MAFRGSSGAYDTRGSSCCMGYVQGFLSRDYTMTAEAADLETLLAFLVLCAYDWDAFEVPPAPATPTHALPHV